MSPPTRLSSAIGCLTDIAMSVPLGMSSVLVMSGATTADDVSRSPRSLTSSSLAYLTCCGARPGHGPGRTPRGLLVIEFVFMLTHHDQTVDQPLDVLAQVSDCGLRYVGFKDIGAEVGVLTDVCAAAQGYGMQVMLEVVSTSREDELRPSPRRATSASTGCWVARIRPRGLGSWQTSRPGGHATVPSLAPWWDIRAFCSATSRRSRRAAAR